MSGFFGKLPSKGDFVSRDLPRDFLDPIDEWFREGIQQSKQTLGEEWFGWYQVTPIWNFYIGGQVLGNGAWIGVWIPSADRVNRSFPLLMAAPADEAGVGTIAAFMGFQGWLVKAGDVLVRALTESQDFDMFCKAFEALSPPGAAASRPAGSAGFIEAMNLPDGLKELVLHFERRLDRIEGMIARMAAPACPETDEQAPAPHDLDEEAFGKNLLASGPLPAATNARITADDCLWQTDGSDDVAEQIVVTRGLPAADQFVNFLKGF